MMSRGSTRVARLMMGQVGPRSFATATARSAAIEPIGAGVLSGAGGFVDALKGSERAAVTWSKFPVMGVRNCSTLTLGEKEQKEVDKEQGTGSAGGFSGGDGGKAVVSYWGVEPAKITKEDGTLWKWNCFRV